MAIPEPTDAYGLWPRVRAVTGWITSDEDQVAALGDDWRGAGAHFADAAAAHRIGDLGAMWGDDVGALFDTRVAGNRERAAGEAVRMTALAERADQFAGEITRVKTGINGIIDANLDTYAMLGVLPAGLGQVAQSVYATQVAGLVEQLITESAGRLADTVPSPPPAGATPEENAAYWRSLTPEQRDRLARERPELVGGRDGFGATHRDVANRVLLTREKAALAAERERLLDRMARNPSAYPVELGRLTEIDDELAGIGVIESRLNQEGYYLLGFDTRGPGEDATAVVTRGNPDTAGHVATYVPGAESHFNEMDRLLRESDSMYASANRTDPANPDSAVITWLGYDAPDTVFHAVSPAYAEAAKGRLDDFQHGLRAADEGPRAHHTVVGHSYGTVVTGYAARDEHLPVDDVLAMGSPGMGVRTAAELNVPDDRVWVLENNDDLVADTQAHGYDPGDDAFGARQLSADPEGRQPTRWWEVDLLDAREPHEDYFYRKDGKDPAYHNIGDVIAGRPPSHP
ncbi:MAG TPA: alpha/beta hydrolase [Actinophytocola sp.]|nr:alpha/beta hydrolase [Actinophytocola sp.]